MFSKLAIIILGLTAHLSMANAAPVKVDLVWKYKNFDGPIQVFEVQPNKASFISETAIVQNLAQAPIKTQITSSISMKSNATYSAVLVVENKSDKEINFFVVPHEVHPSTASAGHYFECLCIGRVYKIPKKSVWYRIVRINLNSSFQNLAKFKIEHNVVGISETEAATIYADRMYNYK